MILTRSLKHSTEALAIARRRIERRRPHCLVALPGADAVSLGRLDEAERLLDEAAPLVSQVGDSTSTSTVVCGIAAERGDWALAGRSYAENARIAGRNTVRSLPRCARSR